MVTRAMGIGHQRNGALARAQDKIEFIQVRHEEMAAFMACGHAKFTGEVGICLATSGPGAIHLLNGQQEVDLTTLFKDVAHEVSARDDDGGAAVESAPRTLS